MLDLSITWRLFLGRLRLCRQARRAEPPTAVRVGMEKKIETKFVGMRTFKLYPTLETVCKCM
jgi:hypothetical protein